MIAMNTEQRVVSLDTIGLIGIAEKIDNNFERHRKNLDYLQYGRKMKEKRNKPKSQFASSNMNSVNRNLDCKGVAVVSLRASLKVIGRIAS